MTHQEILEKDELASGIDELGKLPQPCIHQDSLEVHRRTAYDANRLAIHDPQCPACQQHILAHAPLRSNDAPALVHAIIFYSVFYALYRLNPFNRMFSDVAMWIAWLAVFAYNFLTRTPLRTARNAILILFAIDTVMVYAHFWRGLMHLTFSETTLRAVNSFVASLIAVSPIFVSYGIHFLIKRLKTHARGRNVKMSMTRTLVQASAATQSQVRTHMGEFTDPLRGRDIICFSHDWSGDPLSKTHVMRILARDNRVLWINSIGSRVPTASKADVSRAFNKLMMVATPIREVEKNIFVLNPLAIPAYGKSRLRNANRALLRFQVLRAMRRLGYKKTLNWIFNPAAAIIAGTLGEEKVIYYCVDEYTAFSGVASGSLAELEEELLRRADLVIVSADLLYQSKAPFNRHTVIVRHGVDYTHFRRALDIQTIVPEEIAQLPRPIIGFHGLIADWVDLDLMKEVAKHFSNGSVVMIGKATTDISEIEKLSNVHFLGRKPYADLPAYCKGFDVALNPFRISRLTLNANPLKVREYLAAGLQVVSTAIPEVEILGQCRIGADRDGFIKEIEAALADPGPSIARSEAIRAESWEARVNEIRGHLASLEQA